MTEPTTTEKQADELLAKVDAVNSVINEYKATISKSQRILTTPDQTGDALKIAKSESKARQDIEDNKRAIELMENRLPEIIEPAENLKRLLEQEYNQRKADDLNDPEKIDQETREYQGMTRIHMLAGSAQTARLKREAKADEERKIELANRRTWAA